MRCPKCGFTSFPYPENCGKCGQGLAEQRAALGAYALRSDAPDLRLAYQVGSMDAEGVETALPQAPADIDLGSLEEISLDLAGVDEPLSAPSSGPDVPEATVDLLPLMAFESTSALEAHAADSGVEQAPTHEDAAAPVFDLSELGEITLELEDPARLQSPSVESPQPPMAAPQGRPVYDLDLDAGADDLTLVPEADESEPLEAPQDTIEYVLEVDDEIEVEFEVDELDIEEGDDTESEEGDDDER